MVSKERRIGVYGGTFDPIHSAHIKVARAALDQFGLDELLVVPGIRPPHKQAGGVLDSYHRYAMAVLATLDAPRIVVSTMEINEPCMPYTFETIRRLRSSIGSNARLFFIMGADSYLDFGDWKRPDLILAEANLIVVIRGGVDGVKPVNTACLPGEIRLIDLRDKGARVDFSSDLRSGTVFLTDYGAGELSSSLVRKRAAAGEAIDGMVSPAVMTYIAKYRLYQREV